MIERIHLKILMEVDRLGSLTAAAGKLNLTQSALSHAIRKLENQAGTALWSKVGRNLELTRAGHYVLREAMRLLPQLERVDETLGQYAAGERGSLHIGMECHPCYQWLLKIVSPFLGDWPQVDVDVRQQFKFGGMAALFNHDIDMLVTPDPLIRPGIVFQPVFDYEQVLVISDSHPLCAKRFVSPQALNDQVLLTYPVETDRLDIFRDFLTPAGCTPARHKVIEATEIMLQMVAADRGVACLPLWLVNEYKPAMPLATRRLGRTGLHKQIHLGLREGDQGVPYISAFMELAEASGVATSRSVK